MTTRVDFGNSAQSQGVLSWSRCTPNHKNRERKLKKHLMKLREITSLLLALPLTSSGFFATQPERLAETQSLRGFGETNQSDQSGSREITFKK
jgi:hypothetical protein